MDPVFSGAAADIVIPAVSVCNAIGKEDRHRVLPLRSLDPHEGAPGISQSHHSRSVEFQGEAAVACAVAEICDRQGISRGTVLEDDIVISGITNRQILRLDPACELQMVQSGAVTDAVVSTARRKHIGIIPIFAIEAVVAGSTVEHIVAISAVEGIVTLLAV